MRVISMSKIETNYGTGRGIINDVMRQRDVICKCGRKFKTVRGWGRHVETNCKAVAEELSKYD